MAGVINQTQWRQRGLSTQAPISNMSSNNSNAPTYNYVIITNEIFVLIIPVKNNVALSHSIYIFFIIGIKI